MEITISHLYKRYRGENLLHDITMHIPGGIFGLLGSNGAGKSTLLRILATRLRPTAGTVTVGPYDLASPRARQALRAHLGYAPQLLALPPKLTGRQFLEYVALLKGMSGPKLRHNEVCLLLEELRFEQIADQKIGSYSLGSCRRLSVAQALLGDPELLILDDPFTNLDSEALLNVKMALLRRAHRCTIVLALNHIEHVEQFCQRTAFLDKGAVV
uniref:ABC transporter domain-containing protein n=1 Tax=Thermosporothrix sp. COM3 TaxID=2490863 RepID=A0A455SK02_9CHLR|nr:hypothetical protein KTC_24490 [Thermosporothrix sp. COM3]